MLTLTIDQMRRAEELAARSGLSHSQMMENAGAAACQCLTRKYGAEGRRCLILAGAGNNGGDGFVMARKMAEAGQKPVVALCCGKLKSRLAAEKCERFLAAGGTVIDAEADVERVFEGIRGAGLIIDAIFGIGFHGAAEGSIAEILRRVNASPAVRVSLDIPSGMDADTGEAAGECVKADLTLTFAACKPAHGESAACLLCGGVEVLDIGIPEAVILAALNNVTDIDAALVERLLPVRSPEAHKGSFGRLLAVAGSARMGGAGMMCTLAALRGGAGLTTLAAPESVARGVAPALMEAMTLPLAETPEGTLSASCTGELGKALESATVCLAGCGLSVAPDIQQIVKFIVKNTKCNLVLDADALTCLAADPSILPLARKIPVLTPHPGEMARLCDLSPEQVTENTESVARLFAQEQKAVIVLKGHRTIVATPAGELWRNTTGNAGLAKGGSGDVLAGLIAAFAAQGMSGKNAAICGVFVHGLCADRLAAKMSQYSLLARDLIDELPYTLKSLGR